MAVVYYGIAAKEISAMRFSTLLFIVPALSILGCGSSDDGSAFGASATGGVPAGTGGVSPSGGTPGNPTATGGVSPGAGGAANPLPGASAWAPAPPLAGYTRLVARTIPNVQSGGDVTHCQYLAGPIDRDVDIVAVLGYQSPMGHHATAFEYTPLPGEQVGNDFECMGSEFSGDPASLSQMGPFLGAVGAAGKPSSSSLPEGVAFRHKKGTGIMLSVHFVNTGDTPIDGNAVIDFEMVDVDPNRTIATMFANVSTNVNLPAAQQTTSVVDCPVKSELQFLMMGNHMHEYGARASTVVVHADGTSMDMHTDTTWSNDQSFNPVYSHFPLATPFVVHAGETIRTSCTWNNQTANAIAFPREMCTASGFVLTRGDGAAPLCFNGTWAGTAAL